MKNLSYSDQRPEEKSNCNVVPEVFYPAAEADRLVEMIRPVLSEARQMVAEHPGEYPIFEWFLRSFQFCYEKGGAPGF